MPCRVVRRTRCLHGHASRRSRPDTYNRVMTSFGEPVPARRLDLLAWVSAASFATLVLGGWLTSMGLGDWYDSLAKPPFQPPAWAFSPAWITIFVLLTVATWRVARHPRGDARTMVVFGIQLGLNATWSLLFFALQRPGWALAEIIALDLVVVALALLYARIDRLAGVLLIPYVAWLGLATAITAWIVRNNP